MRKETYLIFDASGSVTKEMSTAYGHVENDLRKINDINVIAYNTVATNVSTIKNTKCSGGNYLSSALVKVVDEIICGEKEVGMVFIAGDMDFWEEDISKVINYVNFLENNKINTTFLIFKESSEAFDRVRVNIDKIKKATKASFRIAHVNAINRNHEPKVKYAMVEHHFEGKKYTFVNNVNAKVGDFVLCDTQKGLDYGRVMKLVEGVEDKSIRSLREVYRDEV